MFHNIYQGKKVFITGHTGFKGSWLALWLSKLGAQVCGYSLAPHTQPSLFEQLGIANQITQSVIGDILDEHLLRETLNTFQPDIVFHLAAQPLVRLSYAAPISTYATNVLGTLHVLTYASQCSTVKAFVNVTSDKCYENKATPHKYRETDPLGGYDMYSSSKACVEIMSSSFRRSFLQSPQAMALATARAGNVIGGGDWAVDRLIPDCVRALVNKTPLVIRNPQAIRPWQYVLEPLSGYLLLGEKLLEEGPQYAHSFNFGPRGKAAFTVLEIAQTFANYYGEELLLTPTGSPLHEESLLQLNIQKAKRQLGWIPIYTTQEALTKTAAWYKRFYQQQTDMLAFTIQQIADYEERVKKNINKRPSC